MTTFLFVCGVAGGIIGGMGMGGGTLLIPLLTLLCTFDQHTAQAVNLIAFIPMSVVSVIIHAKNGLLRPKYLLTVALPAVCVSVLASLLAISTKGEVLSSIFGWFLIALGVFQLFSAVGKTEKKSSPKKAALKLVSEHIDK